MKIQTNIHLSSTLHKPLITTITGPNPAQASHNYYNCLQPLRLRYSPVSDLNLAELPDCSTTDQESRSVEFICPLTVMLLALPLAVTLFVL